MEELTDRRITRRMEQLQISKEKMAEFRTEKCPVCLNEFDINFGCLPCHHVFCLKCLANWAKTNKSCPFCRIPFIEAYDFNG